MLFILTYFPLVLEDLLFYRHKRKYGGIIVKRRNSEIINAASAPKKTKKAHPTYTSRPNTGVARTQAQPGAHLCKAVAREANRRVRLHCPQARSAFLFSGGCMATCNDGARQFSIFPHLKPTSLSYK
jgi:hypothetical protein